MPEPVTFRDFLIQQGADDRDVDLLLRQSEAQPDPQISVIYVRERDLRAALAAAEANEKFRDAAARLTALLPAGGAARPAHEEPAARLAGGGAGEAGVVQQVRIEPTFDDVPTERLRVLCRSLRVWLLEVEHNPGVRHIGVGSGWGFVVENLATIASAPVGQHLADYHVVLGCVYALLTALHQKLVVDAKATVPDYSPDILPQPGREQPLATSVHLALNALCQFMNELQIPLLNGRLPPQIIPSSGLVADRNETESPYGGALIATAAVGWPVPGDGDFEVLVVPAARPPRQIVWSLPLAEAFREIGEAFRTLEILSASGRVVFIEANDWEQVLAYWRLVGDVERHKIRPPRNFAELSRKIYGILQAALQDRARTHGIQPADLSLSPADAPGLDIVRALGVAVLKLENLAQNLGVKLTEPTVDEIPTDRLRVLHRSARSWLGVVAEHPVLGLRPSFATREKPLINLLRDRLLIMATTPKGEHLSEDRVKLELVYTLLASLHQRLVVDANATVPGYSPDVLPQPGSVTPLPTALHLALNALCQFMNELQIPLLDGRLPPLVVPPSGLVADSVPVVAREAAGFNAGVEAPAGARNPVRDAAKGARVDQHGKIVVLKPEADRALVTGSFSAWDAQGETMSLSVRRHVQIGSPVASARILPALGIHWFGDIDYALVDNINADNSGAWLERFMLFNRFRAAVAAFAGIPTMQFYGHDVDMDRFWIENGRVFEHVRPHQLWMSDKKARSAKVNPWAQKIEGWKPSRDLQQAVLEEEEVYKTADGTVVVAYDQQGEVVREFWKLKSLSGIHAFAVQPAQRVFKNFATYYPADAVDFEVGPEWYNEALTNKFEWKDPRFSEPRELTLRDGSVLKVWAVQTFGHKVNGSVGYIIEYPDGTRIGYSGDTRYHPDLLDFYLKTMDVDALYLDIRAMGLRKNGSPDNVHGDPTDRAFTDYFDKHPELLDRIIAIDYDRPDLPLIEQLPFINAKTGDRLFLEGPGREIVVKRIFNTDTVSSFNSDGTSWEVRRNADHVQVTSHLGLVTEAIINPRIEVMLNGALLAGLPVEAAPDNSPEMTVQTLFASGRALVGDDHLLLVDLVRVMRKQGTKLSDEQELAIRRLLARAPRDSRRTRALLARQRGVGQPKGVNLISADGEKGRLVTLASKPESHLSRTGDGGLIYDRTDESKAFLGAASYRVAEIRLRSEIPQFDQLTDREQDLLCLRADALRDIHGHLAPGAIAKMVSEAYADGTIKTVSERPVSNDALDFPSRGGVMVKTSQGWIQIGVPMWTNKDAFLRFLKANGFTLAKEDIPKHVAVTYIDDPEYSGHLNGKLPFDFLGYMFFVTKGTQFTLVAQNKGQADELKRFLDLSYQGQRASDLSASVAAEYPEGAVGIPNTLAEMSRGFESPPPEVLRKVVSFEEQTGIFRMGDVVVRRLGDQRYEIIDQGQSLGVVDLKEHPIPKPDLSRKFQVSFDTGFQTARVAATVYGRVAVWPLGTGHGFDVAGETSGFMIWNGGKVILVDPPSNTLEYFVANGIPLDLIEGVVITHGHTDHYGNAIPQLIETLPRIKLYTTKTIYNMLREQYKAALGSDDLAEWEFSEIKPQERMTINGLNFEFDYSFHPIPALSFEIWNTSKFADGKEELILYFSGDTYAAPDILEKLTKPSADGKPAVMSVERAFRLLRHYFYLPLSQGKTPDEVVALFRKDGSPIKIPDEYVAGLTEFLKNIRERMPEQWTPPQFLIEGGIPPIHIPPELTAKYLKFMEENGFDVSRFHVYHIADKMAEEKGVPKWIAGHRGWIDLTGYFAGDQWRNLDQGVFVDRALRRVPALESLDDADRKNLSDKGILEQFEPGNIIFRAGQYAGDKFYVILDGEVEIIRPDGIRFKTQSGLIGEAGLLGNGHHRNATVRATVPTVLLECSVKEFRGLFGEKGVVATLTKIRENRLHAYPAFAKSPWAELPQEIVTSLLMIGEVEEIRAEADVDDGDGDETDATAGDYGILVQEGDQSRDVYIILGGNAVVMKQGNREFIARLGVGDMVGEMALVRNAPRSASVLRDGEKLKVMRFPAEKLEALMEKYPGIGAALRRLTREREAADARRGNGGGGEASPAPSSATPVASPAAAPAGPAVPPVLGAPRTAGAKSHVSLRGPTGRSNLVGTSSVTAGLLRGACPERSRRARNDMRVSRGETDAPPETLTSLHRSAVSWALSMGLRDTARFIAGLSSRNLERLILVGDQKWSLILKRRGFAGEAAQIAVVASRLVERDRVLLAIAAMGGSRNDVQKLSVRVLQSHSASPGSAHDFSGRSSVVFGAPGLGSSLSRTVPIH